MFHQVLKKYGTVVSIIQFANISQMEMLLAVFPKIIQCSLPDFKTLYLLLGPELQCLLKVKEDLSIVFSGREK